MPLLSCLSRWRVVTALALLAAGAAVAAWLLASWPWVSPAQAAFDRVQVGMSHAEVRAILDPTGRMVGPAFFALSERGFLVAVSWETRDGAGIVIYYDQQDRVALKEFHESDQSLSARVKRLLRWP